MSCIVTNIDIVKIQTASRVCFFAHYHSGNFLADHVLLYLKAIDREGFTTIVLSTSFLLQSDQDKLASMGIGLIQRSNEGLDFGGWIEACCRYFPLRAELLMLANDSVYAPIGDFSLFISKLLSVPADVYGAVESIEVSSHLQSWLMIFRPSAYQSAAFAEIMLKPMPILNKWELIKRYEIGLTQRLRDSGMLIHAAIRMADIPGLAQRYPYNPAHLVWRELIEDGLPFLKVDLLRSNPMRVGDVDDWRTVVAASRPELVPMINDDLRHRPPISPPSLAALSRWDPIYWPEVRWLVRTDYQLARKKARYASRLISIAFRSIVSLMIVPRLAWRAWTR